MNASADRVKVLFLEAVVLDAAADRAALLDRACGGNAGLRADVEGLLAHHAGLGSFLASGPPDLPDTASLSPVEGPGTVIGPYKLLDRIGEGGFGVVHLAEQAVPVRRKVALKVLKPGMDTRQVVARFEAERQALALMDHPNIARVFDGGVTTGGRPYFVMEHVRGVPVTEFCDQDRLTPRQRLELFVHVCHAVQHAHQKGIVHRDIKPSNVLVSRHDTTPVVKVIDFGVAKALGQELTDKTVFTGTAQMIGTPLYMSPEQAGMSDLDVDTRSDIYSLGVLLYELLTGTTPVDKDRFRAVGYDEMRRIIREEEPPKPSTRLSTLAQAGTTVVTARGTDPRKLSRLFRGELDWVVMKALEKDRNRRYETANALAADVQRYLVDEPVLACPPSTGYRLRKFARRSRRFLVTAGLLAVALLIAVGAVAGSLGWAARDRAVREAAVELEAGRAFDEAERWMDQEKWPEALDTIKRGKGVMAGGGSDELRDRAEQLQKDVEMMLRLEEIGQQVAELQTGWHEWDAVHDGYAKAFADYGIDVLNLPEDESATQIRARGRLAVPLAAALDYWAGSRALRAEANRARMRTVAGVVDPDPWRRQVRDALHPLDGAALERLADSPDTARQSRDILITLSNGLKASGRPKKALDALRQSQWSRPGDFWANYWLAHELWWSPDQDRAEVVSFARAAVAIRPKSAGAHLLLCLALRDVGKYVEAAAHARKAIELAPTNPYPHHDLGLVLKRQGKPDEAIVYFQKAIDLWPQNYLAYTFLGQTLHEQKKPDGAAAAYRKAAEFNPNSAEAYYDLGVVLYEQKKLDEAVAAFRKATEIDKQFANAYHELGKALRGQKQLDEAVAAHRKALEINEKYAFAYRGLGNNLFDQNKLDEAVAAYRKAIEINEKYVFAYCDLGGALRKQKKLDEAVAAYSKAIELDEQFSNAYNDIGLVLHDQNKRDEAVAAYRKAIKLDPNSASTFYNLGITLRVQNKVDEAVAAYRKAIELDEKFAKAYNNLGVILSDDQKKLDEAVAAFRKAIELDERFALAYFSLGITLYKQKKRDEAVAAYRKAIEIDEKFAQAYYGLGRVLFDQNKVDEAVTTFHKAIELGEKSAKAYNDLAFALHRQKKLDEAVVAFRKAIEIDEKSAVAYDGLGGILSTQNKLDEAVVALRKAIELDGQFVDAHYGLGLILLKQNKLDEAVTAFRKATELDEKLAKAHHGLGITLRHLNKLDEAVVALRRAIEIDEKFAPAYNSLGFVLDKQNKLDEAVAAYRKAIEIDEKFGIAYTNLGVTLRQQKKRDEAVAAYRKAIEVDPKYGAAHHNLIVSLLESRQFNEAVAATREATKFGLTGSDLRSISISLNSYAWQLATDPDPKARTSATAIELAKLAVKLRPDAPQGPLGAAYYRAGEYKLAVEALERSMKARKGGNSFDWFFLAMAHQRLGNSAIAREWNDKAVTWMDKNKPGDAELIRFRTEASDLLGTAVKAGADVAPPPREKK